MLEFEKMKNCQLFFEKTRKKFVLLCFVRCFSNKNGIKGDFCFKNALLCAFWFQIVNVCVEYLMLFRAFCFCFSFKLSQIYSLFRRSITIFAK